MCAHIQSCPTLCNPMDCSPPGSSVHGIFQPRILEWVAMSFSRGSSQSRDKTHVSCLGRRVLYELNHWGSPVGGEGDKYLLDNKPVSHGWKTPKLNSQVERGSFWPLLAPGPFGSGFKGRVKRQQGLGQGLQRSLNMRCCLHSAGLGKPLTSWCLCSPPARSPRPLPVAPTGLGPSHCSVPTHASSLWLASLEHRTKTRPHTTPDWLAFQLTDTSSCEADLISTL